jgi:hypothetical protein
VPIENGSEVESIVETTINYTPVKKIVVDIDLIVLRSYSISE